LFETALSFMSYHLAGYWATGKEPRRMGTAAAMIAPYEAFRTRDGNVMICVGNDKLFEALARALGLGALATSPAYIDNPARVKNRAILHATLEAVTAAMDTEDLVRVLEHAGVPASAIRAVADVASDPQALALGMFQTAAHPTIAELRSVALPVALEGERPPLRRPPPLLGEHDGAFDDRT
jgi:crotonobetainyl-CoA:carnitine CoA-transferase CaiB-like acyl-CoA transferase